MKVHSEGINGIFVYMDKDGNLCTFQLVDVVTSDNGFEMIAQYVMETSMNEIIVMIEEPENYECLGEL